MNVYHCLGLVHFYNPAPPPPKFLKSKSCPHLFSYATCQVNGYWEGSTRNQGDTSCSSSRWGVSLYLPPVALFFNLRSFLFILFSFSGYIFISLRTWRLSARLESCVINRAAAKINVTFLLAFVETTAEHFASC